MVMVLLRTEYTPCRPAYWLLRELESSSHHRNLIAAQDTLSPLEALEVLSPTKTKDKRELSLSAIPLETSGKCTLWVRNGAGIKR